MPGAASPRSLARTGRTAEALALARGAVARGEGCDKLNRKADALLDLAETLRLAGQAAEAATAAQWALTGYRRKGNEVAARTAAALLASLAGA